MEHSQEIYNFLQQLNQEEKKLLYYLQNLNNEYIDITLLEYAMKKSTKRISLLAEILLEKYTHFSTLHNIKAPLFKIHKKLGIISWKYTGNIPLKESDIIQSYYAPTGTKNYIFHGEISKKNTSSIMKVKVPF
jgi:hypothetical protein